ncbi:MAG TPA: pantoate--beta-alanine ligase [Desulfotomaculum sp.]|nr:MAG: Pantothenate synthetase [Desulfotomaculum sp. 46_80]KUK85392.1 MAG: Pantothenate synthetase [Desulfofundulus kuznetsovii]HAG10651.1 pantoate--beta-alanine ligase [Desulfotomaculum sp.]HBY03387.1 pantoate--beta-alanine ligase [Desulfotomaculum sp.]
MLIHQTVEEIRQTVKSARSRGLTIGFVPTMGYFHEGHLVLMREAKKFCDFVIVSIFVNPMQFGPREDFARYPRDLERDLDLAEKAHVDAVFSPTAEEMYPAGFSTAVEVEGITESLCGLSRPGHFKGVTTVVAKLFNIVSPDKAFFGQKDAQQSLVIKRMVRDLQMPLEVVVVPTVREDDGLAMSSRNVFLNSAERKASLCLKESLETAGRIVAGGELDISKILNAVRKNITDEPLAEIDYVEILSLPDLKPVANLSGPVLLAMAVRFGKTRLIDNTVLCPGGVSYVFNDVKI